MGYFNNFDSSIEYFCVFFFLNFFFFCIERQKYSFISAMSLRRSFRAILCRNWNSRVGQGTHNMWNIVTYVYMRIIHSLTHFIWWVSLRAVWLLCRCMLFFVDVVVIIFFFSAFQFQTRKRLLLLAFFSFGLWCSCTGLFEFVTNSNSVYVYYT